MSEVLQTVFIIDDDADIRTSLARLLASAGYLVQTYSSAAEFLLGEQDDRPGCIVSDLRMPGMDGLDLFGALHSTGRNTPMLFISAYTDVPASVQAMKQGAVDFLVKPVEETALLQSVDRALHLDSERRQQHFETDGLGRRMTRLTRREREVYALVVEGLLNKQIAGRLCISEQTVKVHRRRVMEKMGARSLAELVHFADRLGAQFPAGPATGDPVDARQAG